MLPGKAEYAVKHNITAGFSNEISELTVKNNLVSFECRFASNCDISVEKYLPVGTFLCVCIVKAKNYSGMR